MGPTLRAGYLKGATSFDDSIAVEASKAYFRLEKKVKDEGLTKPSLFDAVVLAIARKNDAKVLTGDEHFEDLPETVWIGDWWRHRFGLEFRVRKHQGAEEQHRPRRGDRPLTGRRDQENVT